MRKIGYLCVGVLLVVFIAFSINVVKMEARETPKPQKKEVVEPPKAKIDHRLDLNKEGSIIRQLPAALETDIQIQHLPLLDSDSDAAPVTPY